MVRLLGNNLANKKKIFVALTSIYGIGISRALEILKKVNLDPNTKVSYLNEKNIYELRNILESDDYKLEGNLKRIISLNIKRLIDIQSYRGKRHLMGMPVRGQRTRTNSVTSKMQNTFVRTK